jgi:hypothetical protein
MMKVEDGIAWAGEGIILQTTDRKVTSGVEERLWLGAVDFPAVGPFLQTVDILAAEEVFHI